MKTLLLTGGKGDIASYLKKILIGYYIVEAPSREKLDVSCCKSVEEYFKDKKYDVVINLAGTLHSSKILDSDSELWIKDIQVNLIGTYLVCKEALLKNKKTKLINISSTAAFNSYNNWSSYCASKSGVLKISSALYKDGYDVITLCPGAIDTKFRDGLNINNPNIMTIEEGCEPIILAIKDKYDNGDVIFYRKGFIKKILESDYSI
ncbi:TPA: SDR family NAD(P)-dependent oxidoreductase [Vibrio parahaemolyticus]|nr:SDR family NAD(P)-dependent oxidoreductase [Vibrio parahaemolyticus]HBB9973089.1 SDR family NAD(P)-dependent oxidoreductase [Vibrio parahaemolyticus]HBC0008986.1 SDR family NAD(P)-dependent oxidoreductase [Vibrio parahaemolyticus]